MNDLLAAQVIRELARDSGLSDADYTVLVVLSEAPGHRMRSIELTRRTMWSKSRLSHQLTRMEGRGLVRREEPADNARACDAVLTEDGLRRIETAAPAHVESVRRHFIDLLTDDELDMLGAVTERVVAHLTETGEHAAEP
ncbi:MarR family transcriptional regulator [Haloactinopolyspora alba]|uniref:MarR family transcriptional regulator n=2 Tax=Haloactinopolyspora alba TaxID=648780 RepID=A0A2P8DWJ6_9ACTN|nr:MarR family transcriptional regulator [Haloactinopolyspora alba]